MIIDRIANCQLYSSLGPRFAKAFQLLQAIDFSTYEAGRYEVDGQDLYFIIQAYQTKPIEDGKIEAHRKYADIQAVLKGHEHIGYADLSTLQPGEYIEAKDFHTLTGKVDLVKVNEGFFMLLFPNDGHMPGIRIQESEPVRKVVFKVML